MSDWKRQYVPIDTDTTIPDLIVGMACLDGDARLSDARTPTAHTHAQSDIVGARYTKGVDTTDDLIVDNTAKGLVLKDSVTGHYFRITLSLGVIGLSDLGTTKP